MEVGALQVGEGCGEGEGEQGEDCDDDLGGEWGLELRRVR